MESTIFALLVRSLEEQKEGIRDYLACGGARSYEDYCRATGQYQAIEMVVDNVKELEKRFIAD